MSRLFMTGFEAGDTTGSSDGFAEGLTGGAQSTAVVQQANARTSGGWCLASTTSVNGESDIVFSNVIAAPTLARDYFLRGYIKKTANPTVTLAQVLRFTQSGGTFIVGVSVNTSGVLELHGPSNTLLATGTTVLADNTYYRVELRCQVNTTTTGQYELRLDGNTEIAAVTNANLGTGAPANIGVGQSSSGGNMNGGTIFYDDIAVNDNQGTAQNSWPGDGKIVHLVPVSDVSGGAGWVRDNNATSGSFWAALDNSPPAGIADTTASTGLHQIRNGTSNANSDVIELMTTYTDAGIGAGDTLQCMQAAAITGAPSATSPKAGSMQISSNPVDPGLVSIGNFYNGAAIAGTYPTGWAVRLGTVYDLSNTNLAALTSANYGTNPQVTLRQVTASTRVAMCCAIYMRVEYLPAAPAVLPDVVMAPPQAA